MDIITHIHNTCQCKKHISPNAKETNLYPNLYKEKVKKGNVPKHAHAYRLGISTQPETEIQSKNERERLYHHLVNEEILRKRQAYCGLGVAKDTVGFDGVAFRVDVHLWHGVVVLHVGFADVAAVLDGFNALLDSVGLDGAGVDGGLGDEHD